MRSSRAENKKKGTRKKRRNAQSPLFRKCQQATHAPHRVPLPSPPCQMKAYIYNILYAIYLHAGARGVGRGSI